MPCHEVIRPSLHPLLFFPFFFSPFSFCVMFWALKATAHVSPPVLWLDQWRWPPYIIAHYGLLFFGCYVLNFLEREKFWQHLSATWPNGVVLLALKMFLVLIASYLQFLQAVGFSFSFFFILWIGQIQRNKKISKFYISQYKEWEWGLRYFYLRIINLNLKKEIQRYSSRYAMV